MAAQSLTWGDVFEQVAKPLDRVTDDQRINAAFSTILEALDELALEIELFEELTQ